MIYLRTIATHDCNTWTTTGGDYTKPIIFEKKILRKIYGLIFNDK